MTRRQAPAGSNPKSSTLRTPPPTGSRRRGRGCCYVSLLPFTTLINYTVLRDALKIRDGKPKRDVRVENGGGDFFSRGKDVRVKGWWQGLSEELICGKK